MSRRTTILIATVALVALGLGISTFTSDEPNTPDDAAIESAAIQSEQLSEDIILDGTLEPLTRTITHRSGSEAISTTNEAPVDPAGESTGGNVVPVSTAAPLTAALAQTDETTTTTSTTTPATESTTTTSQPPSPPTTPTSAPTTSTPPTTTPSRSAVPTEGDRPTGTEGSTQEPEVADDGGAPEARPTEYVTDVPTVGDVIAPGDALYSADGQPIWLLPGSAPAWRTLEAALTGPDVAQLESYLSELGYDVGTVDDTFDATTTAAVFAWQQDLGVEDTGIVELGSVLFASGAVTVTAVHVSVGDSVADGDSVLDIAGTDLQATLTIDPDLVRLVLAGQEFDISVTSDQSVTGIIASVVANPRGGAIAVANLSEQPEVAVAPISITARRTALATDTVLTVPATALVKLDQGGYAVRLDTGVLVAVEIGASSGSTVAIVSPDLQAGDLVQVT